MVNGRTYEVHVYVEEEGSGDRYLYVESVYANDKPVLLAGPILLALLMGTGATYALPVAPERGLPPHLSRAVQVAAATEQPQHPTWLNSTELAEVEARYYALTGKHEPQVQQLLDRMKGHSNWRVVVWLTPEA
jgi:hypothetical protein